MYCLAANFYPAHEPLNGYIGKAQVTVGNAIRLNNISVFEKEDGSLNIQFACFGKNDEHSYVATVRKDDEDPEKVSAATEALRGVVKAAKNAENHFAYVPGDFLKEEDLIVTGVRVKEPYADGRFSITVGDFIILNGITTNYVGYSQDGKDRHFVATNFPTVRDEEGHVKMYTTKDGRAMADLQYEGIINKWEGKDGKTHQTNWNQKLAAKVRACRHEVTKAKDLEEQIAKAEKSKASVTKAEKAPVEKAPAKKKGSKKKADTAEEPTR